MDKDIKGRWLEALRSGTYEQGEGGLYVDGKYCCLGVLCDLYVKDGKGTWKETVGGAMSIIGTSGFLPPAVSHWSGVGSTDPDVDYGDTETLSGLNDDGIGFGVIAGLIEEQY